MEGENSGHEPGHVLAQLSAALENPDIKALEWSKNGQSVLVHAKLYEEEMGKNKELFPALADLSCAAALQAWLLAYGFKTKGAKKANTQKLVLQHPEFRRAPPTTEEPGAKQQKKKSKKRPARSLDTPRGTTFQDRPRQQPRLRPLYPYINLDLPELMDPAAADDEVPGLAQPNQASAAPRRADAPQLDGELQPETWASSALELPDAEVANTSTQIDTDRMLRYMANLLPPLFPQYQ